MISPWHLLQIEGEKSQVLVSHVQSSVQARASPLPIPRHWWLKAQTSTFREVFSLCPDNQSHHLQIEDVKTTYLNSNLKRSTTLFHSSARSSHQHHLLPPYQQSPSQMPVFTTVSKQTPKGQSWHIYVLTAHIWTIINSTSISFKMCPAANNSHTAMWLKYPQSP